MAQKSIPSLSLRVSPSGFTSEGGLESSNTNKAPPVKPSLLGSLYGDIDTWLPSKDQSSKPEAGTSTGWASHRSKLMAPPVLRKKENAPTTVPNTVEKKSKAPRLLPPPQMLRNASYASTSSSTSNITDAPSTHPLTVSDSLSAGTDRATPSSTSGILLSSSTTSQNAASLVHHSASSPLPQTSSSIYPTTSPHFRSALRADIEYDPRKPNDYDLIRSERNKKRQQEELQEKMAQEIEIRKREKIQPDIPGGSTPYFSNTPSSRSGISTSQISSFQDNNAADIPPQAEEHPPDSKRNFAARMMEKMGWKHGEGLGRDKQGIIAPLVAKKTDRRGGVIVPGRIANKTPIPSNPSNDPLPSAITPILLLTNLVDELDASLIEDVKEEASKYGNLLDVNTYVDEAADVEERVRIFCEFESSDSALQAYKTFNGRMFDGRTVRARFYDSDLFNKGELGQTFDTPKNIGKAINY